MSTKAFDKKTAAFIGFLIQNMPEIDNETMNEWMNNPNGTKKFLSGLNPPETAKKQPLLSIIATTPLGATKGKKTEKCFTGSRWAYRDSDFDNWLSENQPDADACIITTLAPSRHWTFVEAAVAILGIISIDTNTDDAAIGEHLIGQGHTMTLAQAEEMVEATERGEEKTKMCVDGYGNFFFIETGDPKNPVSVGYVYRGGRGWNAHVNRLVHGNRWSVGHRLLVRNLEDTLKL